MCALSIVLKSQSIWEAKENMIVIEGRKEYQTWLAQWQKGMERSFSSSIQAVYGLCTVIKSGAYISCSNAFVIWTTSQEDFHRSSIHSKFCSRFTEKNTHTCKGRSQFPTKEILWIIQTSKSAPYAFHLQWKKHSLSTFLLFTSRDRSLKISDVQDEM